MSPAISTIVAAVPIVVLLGTLQADKKIDLIAATPAAQAAPGLVAVAHSVATTLSDGSVEVHECAADDCTLFFAVPKGALERRWCSLEPCGRETRVERRRGAFR